MAIAFLVAVVTGLGLMCVVGLVLGGQHGHPCMPPQTQLWQYCMYI